MQANFLHFFVNRIDHQDHNQYIHDFSQIDAFNQNVPVPASIVQPVQVVEAAKPLQERQVEKVAKLVGANNGTGANIGSSPLDSTITADRATVTYRATVPPGTSDDQMQKIV